MLMNFESNISHSSKMSNCDIYEQEDSPIIELLSFTKCELKGMLSKPQN